MDGTCRAMFPAPLIYIVPVSHSSAAQIARREKFHSLRAEKNGADCTAPFWLLTI
jgi:hypothetical protein